MKKDLTKLTVISLCVILSLPSSIAFAHDNVEIDRLINRLQLNDFQSDQFKELMNSKPDKSMMSKQREEIRELIAADNIELAADLAANNARERVYNRASYDEKLSAILTVEQLELLEKMRSRKGSHSTNKQN